MKLYSPARRGDPEMTNSLPVWLLHYLLHSWQQARLGGLDKFRRTLGLDARISSCSLMQASNRGYLAVVHPALRVTIQ